MRDGGSNFQADEAFADLLKKRKQPVGLKASLKESVGASRRSRRCVRGLGRLKTLRRQPTRPVATRLAAHG
jgi:hypothetical protein